MSVVKSIEMNAKEVGEAKGQLEKAKAPYEGTLKSSPFDKEALLQLARINRWGVGRISVCTLCVS